jgi:hypothetical protein
MSSTLLMAGGVFTVDFRGMGVMEARDTLTADKSAVTAAADCSARSESSRKTVLSPVSPRAFSGKYLANHGMMMSSATAGKAESRNASDTNRLSRSPDVMRRTYSASGISSLAITPSGDPYRTRDIGSTLAARSAGDHGAESSLRLLRCAQMSVDPMMRSGRARCARVILRGSMATAYSEVSM